MNKTKSQIIAEKRALADHSLEVAISALRDIEVAMEEPLSVKDLLSIYNSAIKNHREISTDLINMAKEGEESQEEAKLAVEYTGKINDLISKFKK